MIVGDSRVGKTAILLRWFDDKFEYFMHDPTEGFDSMRKRHVKTEYGTINLRIFEIPGDPKYEYIHEVAF